MRRSALADSRLPVLRLKLGLYCQHQLHRLAHQHETPAQQVTGSTLLARIDVAFGQQPQPQQLRQVQGIGVVVAVLEAVNCGTAVVCTRRTS